MRKLLLLISLVLAACAGDSSEGPSLTFADFDSPPTTSAAESSPQTASSTPETSSSTTTSTTLLVVDTPSPVVIVNDEGFSILEGRGAPQRMVETPLAAGFDDLQGGFVFQVAGAGVDPAADQRVFWSRALAPDAQPYLAVNAGSLLKLWGIELIGGEPKMILTVTDDADDPVERLERLVVFDFANGDRVLGEVGGPDSGPRSISYGGGRFLLEQTAGAQSFFEFRNDQGAVIDLASNPQPGCADDPTCPTAPTLDPTGSFVAFLQPGPDETLSVVVHDLDLDEEISRIALPQSAGDVLSLDFDGNTTIVNRRTPDGEERAIIVDTRAGTYGEFGLTGLVQFLRVGPAFEGPVTISTE